ncbi:TetR/AcrR family transcriptional regulator [Vulgatibacter sp.]|uniref:TetR/AcrR family transcriptional regulator n=1 Tax=Vulgatibacter sp. TaxID=1971226 RepID=UPI003561A82D
MALERALELFWTQGYEATSLADLTRAMEIAPPSLYAAFGNKEQLFLEAVARYVERYGGFTERALAEEPTARGAIERILHEAAAEYTVPGRPPGCFVFSGATNCSAAAAEVEEALRRMRRASEAVIRRRLERAAAEGELPPGADAASLAGFVATVMEGMSQQARDGAGRAHLQAIAGAAMAAWPAPRTRRARPPRR